MKPILKFLSDQEILLVHETSLRILNKIGMKMPHKEAHEILKKAGASVNEETGMVFFPESLVSDALKNVPKRSDVVLYAQNPDQDIRFVDNVPTNVCMTMAIDVIDPWDGKRRAATNEDLARLTWLADRNPTIAVNGGLVTPQDVPGEYNDWYTWATCLKNTTKHITGGMLGARCVRDAVEMASIVIGSKEAFMARPFISGWVLTLPCLGIDFESLDAMMEMNRLNLPIILTSGPMVGASSPMSCAGSLAQAHAEMLACITLSQIINPGCPIIYTSFIRSLDMRSVTACMGSPESGMMRAAMAQIGKYFDLPVRMPGLLRDSKVLDAQAGFETALTGVMNILNAYLMDSMQLDSDLLVDYADLVFTPDSVQGLQRVAKGIDVTESVMDECFETIKEIGCAGSFLEHPQTLKKCRKEIWHPKLHNRQNYSVWKENGGKDIRQNAIEKIITLLEEREGAIISQEKCAEIDKILARLN